MAMAFMVRGTQRQKLIEELMNKVYEKEDEMQQGRGGAFRWGNLVRVMLENLEDDSFSNKEDTLEEARFFVHFVLGPITRFARSPEERDALVCEFLQKVIDELFAHKHISALQRQEMFDPQRIFHASSSTAEMVFNF